MSGEARRAGSARRYGYSLSREQRIEHIARLIRADQWKRGDSKALAAEWDVPLELVERASSDAALLLDLARKLFDEETKAEVVKRFGDYLRSA